VCTGSVCGCPVGYTVGRPVRASSPRPDPLGHCSPGGGGQEGGRAGVRTVRATEGRTASEERRCGRSFRSRASQALSRPDGRRAGGAGSFPSHPILPLDRGSLGGCRNPKPWEPSASRAAVGPDRPLAGGDRGGRRGQCPGDREVPGKRPWGHQASHVGRPAGHTRKGGSGTPYSVWSPYTKSRVGHPCGGTESGSLLVCLSPSIFSQVISRSCDFRKAAARGLADRHSRCRTEVYNPPGPPPRSADRQFQHNMEAVSQSTRRPTRTRPNAPSFRQFLNR